MNRTAPAGTTRRRRLGLRAFALIATAVIVVTFAYQWASSALPPPVPLLNGMTLPTEPGEATIADGVVPDDVTVFDDQYPAVAKLDEDLLEALKGAAREAAEDGVVLYVTSGWRSPRYQEELLLEAVAKYGSREVAARWVATPTTSAHVSGDAVDIGPTASMYWLSRHGAKYGLCRIYGNEPWHFELRPDAVEHGCPPMYPDPTYDPRLQ